MLLKDLANKRVSILGFGREGRAVLHVIQKFAPNALVTVRDQQSHPANEQKEGISFLHGEEWLKGIENDDILIKSPGIPPAVLPESIRNRVTNSTQLFLDEAAAIGATVIGVSGTKGKSTTTSLIGALLRADNRKVEVVGNIGLPSIESLDRLSSDTYVVLEMSSYQLADLTRSPQVAVLTSFYPEHLDYHGSLDSYREAKSRIVQYQSSADTVVFNEDQKECRDIALQSKGNKVGFSVHTAPIRIEQTKLIGSHNLSNIAAAYAVGTLFSVPHDTMLQVFRTFEGLPHRLQRIVPGDPIIWIDDAISTTPESAVAALEALGSTVQTIILGGLDRGYDFTSLISTVATSSVKTCILFPETGKKIGELLRDTPVRSVEATSMTEAVQLARQYTETGKTCLLSPASPSYNMFKNFEDRGDQFKAAIESSNN